MKHLQRVEAYHFSIWGQKDLSAIDTFFAKEVVVHSPVRTTQGAEQMKNVIAGWHNAFPNLTVSWDDYICEGDKVVSRWHAQGCQEGEFLTIPATHKNVSYTGVSIYQFKEDKVVAYWAFVDMEHLKSQLLAKACV